jgi:hypothetical protein
VAIVRLQALSVAEGLLTRTNPLGSLSDNFIAIDALPAAAAGRRGSGPHPPGHMGCDCTRKADDGPHGAADQRTDDSRFRGNVRCRPWVGGTPAVSACRPGCPMTTRDLADLAAGGWSSYDQLGDARAAGRPSLDVDDRAEVAAVRDALGLERTHYSGIRGWGWRCTSSTGDRRQESHHQQPPPSVERGPGDERASTAAARGCPTGSR